MPCGSGAAQASEFRLAQPGGPHRPQPLGQRLDEEPDVGGVDVVAADAVVGVAAESFETDALRTIDTFRAELRSVSFDERRLVI